MRETYEKVSQNEASSEDKDNCSIKSYAGCLLAILAACLFPIANIFIKMSSFLNGVEHLLVFMALKLIVLSPMCVLMGQNPLGEKRHRWLLIARGIIGSVASVLCYKGIVLLPPSDTASLVHTCIIITAVISRLALNEKLDLSHLLSLGLTIIGIVLISKPSFLFEQSSVDYDTNKLIGVVCVLISSLFYGIVNVLIKKLCNLDSHWTCVAIYDSYFGIPLSIATIYFLLKFDPLNRKRDYLQIELAHFLSELVYSSISACLSISGQICVTKAFHYEEATNVSIFRACDVFIAFILQLIILGLRVDYLSVLGSMAIVSGIFIVIGFSRYERFHRDRSKSSVFLKILFFKF